MTVPLAVLGVEELHQDRVAGQGRHGQGGNELLGRGRHDDLDLGAFPDQQTGEICRLIGRNAPRDAQKYVFALEQHDVVPGFGDYCRSSTLR